MWYHFQSLQDTMRRPKSVEPILWGFSVCAPFFLHPPFLWVTVWNNKESEVRHNFNTASQETFKGLSFWCRWILRFWKKYCKCRQSPFRANYRNRIRLRNGFRSAQSACKDDCQAFNRLGVRKVLIGHFGPTFFLILPAQWCILQCAVMAGMLSSALLCLRLIIMFR